MIYSEAPKNKKPPISVNLLIHGFGGGHKEMEYLENHLQDQGLQTHSVLLAGHGSNKKVLKKSSHLDWLNSVNQAAVELAQTYEKVNLIGFSMGGLLAVSSASLPQIHKIVLINTPIYFWNLRIIVKDIVRNIRDRETEKINFYMKAIRSVSIKTDLDFLKVLSESKKKLKTIHNQTLILQCRHDESAHFKSAKYIKKRIGNHAYLKYYDGGCHMVLLTASELRDSVCHDIHRFLGEDDTEYWILDTCGRSPR
ncbi:MAG: alpha/beta fold hydrolase [Peptococcaceae bacterium]|nr:alpha/beta fold hydrolase [Peptococcaceae bacterium]